MSDTRHYFGTDGIRGTANLEPMTPETALRVAMAAGAVLNRGGHRHRALIGKDTRLSGYLIEPALTAGFIAMGIDVILVGPMPTPAVAMLTRSLRADLGVVISASHNPYQDNGIKLFGADGFKLSDAVEMEIEAKLHDGFDHDRAGPADLGKASRLEDAAGRYIEYVKNTLSDGRRLEGLKVVIDCAHGAAYRVAPQILWELGAEVIEVGTDPDGFNINKDVGATAPALLGKTVVEHGADIGIALDGDADRLIITDQHGTVIDGDQIMALLASHWAGRNSLRGDGVVATVMSNLGLERYLAAKGLKLIRTKVGDRYVVEHMRAHGFNLGGEQSGHLVMSDYSTTGDGLLAALQILDIMVAEKQDAASLLTVFEPVPQVLKNIRFAGANPLETEAVKSAIHNGEAALDKTGRVLVRKSGTEPKIRVMAEGDDPELVERVVDDIIAAIATESGKQQTAAE
ncbi:MAG: phosphoglucosamine mutase [Alphaproteobacteria bacterium]|nr:phosphoglucosamine mutase [Alphaproteobacteria bacterium]MAS49006.1 phosphoglucosamine mutase [Alphaproteobacteria bacterium]MBN52606.1 phosphoglucosamine mutase [Alphaproteobacteria bacterium]OUT39613.1 MAG: phosphoglucosamine mutase [Micavibrio sp. TMED2]|tara:strand:+ start:1994 stop:3367 length:1374 start_codon:yes stop_codon:yes gene_type:complete